MKPPSPALAAETRLFGLRVEETILLFAVEIKFRILELDFCGTPQRRERTIQKVSGLLPLTSGLATAGFDSGRSHTRLADFEEGLTPRRVALFYFAGHGIQVDGENYLIPISFSADDEMDAKARALPASRVQKTMEDSGMA